MHVQSLEFLNFRNYEKLKILFDPGINIIYGDNAQGKTNIIEGIYICSTSGSHRRSTDREMVRFGSADYHIKMQAYKNNELHRIDIQYTKDGKKGIAIDGIAIRKASEMFGYLNAVIFAPEDLSLIKNGPAERRRFLDREICQSDPIYLDDLSTYNKVLMNRNKLLKSILDNPSLEDTLDVWDEQLSAYANRIIRKRREYILETEEICQKKHLTISAGKERMKIKYKENEKEDTLLDSLKRNRKRDIYTMTTNCGPHRDDFIIEVNGTDIRRFGSQGQIRSAAVSLKLSEIDIIKKKTGEMPVLLLDDVMSELDHHRQECLLEEIKETQTIITATGTEDIVNRKMKGKLFFVKEGTVTEERKQEV